MKFLYVCALTLALSLLGRGKIDAADIEWISAGVSSGTVGERTCYRPKINGDGRFIVFESRDAEIPLSRTKFRDIFLFDRNKQTLKKIEPINMERSNSDPAVSEGGRYVAYQSYPLSVIMGQPPLTADIFLYDRYLNKSSLQTFGQGDTHLDGENRDPVFSADGRKLVYTSNATIYPGMKDGITRQIYLYDHESRNLDLVSKSPSGDPGNRPSGDPRVSRNGHFVAFKSAATNLLHLLPLDSLVMHLYLADRREKALIQIDEVERGFNPDQFTVGRYDMDIRGETIVFEGRKRNQEKPLEILTTTDLFIFNRSTGTISLITTGIFAERSHSPCLSGDGRYLAFVFRGISKGEKVPDGLVVYDIELRRWTKAVNGSLSNPAFSQNGQFITFESNQSDLVSGASNKVLNIYVVKNPFFEP